MILRPRTPLGTPQGDSGTQRDAAGRRPVAFEAATLRAALCISGHSLYASSCILMQPDVSQAAGAPHIFKGAPHPHTVGCGHSYGHSYVSGPAGGGGGGSGFYASSGLYACPGTAAAGAAPRLPLRMLNFGEPLNAIMSMDQSWPPSLGSSIDMHGSNGVLEQACNHACNHACDHV